MVIDFDHLPLQHLARFKGGEGEILGRMYTDDMGKIVRLTLPAGASIGLHTHDTSAEIMYFLSGTGIILADDLPDGDPLQVTPGMCCYCPRGESHSLINNGTEPLTLLAVIPELG